MYGAKVNETRTAVRDVAFRLRNAERLVTLYRDDLVPQAERAVETAQARSRPGSRGPRGRRGGAERLVRVPPGARPRRGGPHRSARPARSACRAQPDRARRRRGRPRGGWRNEAGASLLLLAALALAAQPACASKYRTLRGGGGVLHPAAALSGRWPARATRRRRPAAGRGGRTAFAAAARAPAATRQRSGSRRSAGAERGERRSSCPPPSILRALAGAAADADVAGAALGDGFSLQTLETLALLRNPMVKAKESRGARGARGLRAGGADRRGAAHATPRCTATSMAGGGMGAAAGLPVPRGPRAQGADRRRGGARGPRTARGGAARRGRRGAQGVLGAGLRRPGRRDHRPDDRAAREPRPLGRVPVRGGQDQLPGPGPGPHRAREGAGGAQDPGGGARRTGRPRSGVCWRCLPTSRSGAPAFREDCGDASRAGEAGGARARAAPGGAGRRRDGRPDGADAGDGRDDDLPGVRPRALPGAARGDRAVCRRRRHGRSRRRAPARRPPRPRRPPQPAVLRRRRGLRARDPPAHRGAEERARGGARRDARRRARRLVRRGPRPARGGALRGEGARALPERPRGLPRRGTRRGRSAFSDLLESYTGWLEASLARQRARADIGIARAGLEAAVGVSDLEADQRRSRCAQPARGRLQKETRIMAADRRSGARRNDAPAGGSPLGLVVLLLLAGGGAAWYGGLFHQHGAGEDATGEKYTCGMHPWIITDKPGDCPICGMKLTRIETQPARPRRRRRRRAEERGGGLLRGRARAPRSRAGAQDPLLPQPDEPDGHLADAGEGRDGHGLRPVYEDEAVPPAGAAAEGLATVRVGGGRPAPLGRADRAGRARDRRPHHPHRGDRGPGRDAGPPRPDEGRGVDRAAARELHGPVRRRRPAPGLDLLPRAAGDPGGVPARAEDRRTASPPRPTRRSGASARTSSRSARRRLELFDVPASFIAELEKTGDAAEGRDPRRPLRRLRHREGAPSRGRRSSPGMELFTLTDLSRVWIEAVALRVRGRARSRSARRRR